MVSAAFVYGVNPRLFKPVSTCFTLLFSPVLQRMVVTIFRLYWTVYKDYIYIENTQVSKFNYLDFSLLKMVHDKSCLEI